MPLVSNRGDGTTARHLVCSRAQGTKTTRTVWGFAVGLFRFSVPFLPQGPSSCLVGVVGGWGIHVAHLRRGPVARTCRDWASPAPRPRAPPRRVRHPRSGEAIGTTSVDAPHEASGPAPDAWWNAHSGRRWREVAGPHPGRPSPADWRPTRCSGPAGRPRRRTGCGRSGGRAVAPGRRWTYDVFRESREEWRAKDRPLFVSCDI
jgi:hypothetical protein